MNLILYGKNELIKNGFTELMKNDSGINVLTASSRHEVLDHFSKTKNIGQLVFWNIAMPSDLGLVQFVKKNYPDTRILVFAPPLIKESIEIIKGTDIEVMNNTIDELKKVHGLISRNS